MIEKFSDNLPMYIEDKMIDKRRLKQLEDTRKVKMETKGVGEKYQGLD